jgi:hypothetical protein
LICTGRLASRGSCCLQAPVHDVTRRCGGSSESVLLSLTLSSLALREEIDLSEIAQVDLVLGAEEESFEVVVDITSVCGRCDPWD